jgi:hypothetical protein
LQAFELERLGQPDGSLKYLHPGANTAQGHPDLVQRLCRFWMLGQNSLYVFLQPLPLLAQQLVGPGGHGWQGRR